MNRPVRSSTQEQLISLAKDYPYRLPTTSYIFLNGQCLEIEEFDLHSLKKTYIRTTNGVRTFQQYIQSTEMKFPPDMSERVPVLAYGSNASSEALTRKFSKLRTTVVIPTIKAKLRDFDVVYSAHFSNNSSIPAALQYSPGTEVDLFVNYLTESQLERLHKTEMLGVNYSFGQLLDVAISLEDDFTLSEILSYFTLHGCLFINSSHISLAAISAQHRVFPQMPEIQIQMTARDLCAPGKELDEFILENIQSSITRSQRTARLEKYSRPFSYSKLRMLRK
ncbi:MAG: hypothetical protein ACE5JS_12290 [Nitrospinota bacterium]